jgi:hypothetical protein
VGAYGVWRGCVVQRVHPAHPTAPVSRLTPCLPCSPRCAAGSCWLTCRIPSRWHSWQRFWTRCSSSRSRPEERGRHWCCHRRPRCRRRQHRQRSGQQGLQRYRRPLLQLHHWRPWPACRPQPLLTWASGGRCSWRWSWPRAAAAGSRRRCQRSSSSSSSRWLGQRSSSSSSSSSSSRWLHQLSSSSCCRHCLSLTCPAARQQGS